MDRVGNQKLSGMDINIPVAAGATITEAVMVAVGADGYAVAASKSAGLTIAGCAMRHTDNASGSNGAVSVPVILKDAYVSDEKTVTITEEGSSRAGKILAADTDGVTVEML